MSRMLKMFAVSACAVAALTGAAAAQGGPVATACKDDIPKYCAGLEHGQGKVRACLEAHKSKVSEGCRTALDTTGGGRGRNQN